jgi:hypothetical protein
MDSGDREYGAVLDDESSAEFLAAVRGIKPNTQRSAPPGADTPVVIPANACSVDSMEEQLRQIGTMMSDDLEDIRQKILAERRNESGDLQLTAEEERRAYAELKAKHQIDLNDKRNIAELEDKGLMSHMESARRLLAEQEKCKAGLPSREDVKASHVKSLRQFSALVQELRTTDLELQSGVEETFLQARNATRIGGGETPHSFPGVPQGKPANHEALAMLSTKIDRAGNSCQESSKAITSAIQTLDVLRRDSESVVDALTKMVDHYRKAYDALEQLLGGSAT